MSSLRSTHLKHNLHFATALLVTSLLLNMGLPGCTPQPTPSPTPPPPATTAPTEIPTSPPATSTPTLAPTTVPTTAPIALPEFSLKPGENYFSLGKALG